jgi:hypothetical protein
LTYSLLKTIRLRSSRSAKIVLANSKSRMLLNSRAPSQFQPPQGVPIAPSSVPPAPDRACHRRSFRDRPGTCHPANVSRPACRNSCAARATAPHGFAASCPRSPRTWLRPGYRTPRWHGPSRHIRRQFHHRPHPQSCAGDNRAARCPPGSGL